MSHKKILCWYHVGLLVPYVRVSCAGTMLVACKNHLHWCYIMALVMVSCKKKKTPSTLCIVADIKKGIQSQKSFQTDKWSLVQLSEWLAPVKPSDPASIENKY